MTAPAILSVKRRNGIAGTFEYTARVQYPDEAPQRVTFVGDVYGGPIVMVSDGLPRGVFVSSRVLDRIGHTLTEAWVRAFFAPNDV